MINQNTGTMLPVLITQWDYNYVMKIVFESSDTVKMMTWSWIFVGYTCMLLQNFKI